jgi:hypothetical protein
VWSSITYNIGAGDLAFGWEADHVNPGVNIENKESDTSARHSEDLSPASPLPPLPRVRLATHMSGRRSDRGKKNARKEDSE